MAVLDEAVRLLGAEHIPVMPLKGIWLQQQVYADPSDRQITDVDILVPEEDYAAAANVLRSAGWRCSCWNVWEATLRSPHFPLAIDLHCSLFPSNAFNMPTADLFRRGRRDVETFGLELVLPDPRDVFAHLVGHFVKSQGGVSESRIGTDLAKLGHAFHLEPRALAQHLEACGMARAARFALAIAAGSDTTGFCQAVAAMLDADRIGDAAVRVLLRWRPVLAQSWLLDLMRGFALEASWRRSARTLLYTVRDGRRRRREAPQQLR
jgi:hypothetical protein